MTPNDKDFLVGLMGIRHRAILEGQAASTGGAAEMSIAYTLLYVFTASFVVYGLMYLGICISEAIQDRKLKLRPDGAS